jgi:hypothetical protein
MLFLIEQSFNISLICVVVLLHVFMRETHPTSSFDVLCYSEHLHTLPYTDDIIRSCFLISGTVSIFHHTE